MQKQGLGDLVQIFTTARDENLHAARENWEYIYLNGGYSFDRLALIFQETIPAIKWDKSSARFFIYPDSDSHKVALLSATPQQITNFLEKSIQLREAIQTEFAKGKKLMEDARARWRDLEEAHLERQNILDNIRENFRYAHDNGNIPLKAFTPFFKASCPEYAWSFRSIRRFLYPEQNQNRQSHLNALRASSEMLLDLLKASIDERTRAMEGKLPAAVSPDSP